MPLRWMACHGRGWSAGGECALFPAMELKASRYEVTDGIAVVTLSRPKRRNAWTGRMHTEYRWILREAEGDPAVR